MRFAKLVSLMYSCASRVSALFVSPQVFTKTSLALTDDHLQIAKLCRRVYSKDVESSDNFVESKDTGVQATVARDGSRAIVCFRGSSSLVDWRTNLKTFKVPFLSRKHNTPENEIHAGFFIGHNSVKAKIYAKLNAIIDSGECESVLFSGHSAGGVLSTISAFDFQNEKHITVKVVTFGAPKLGNGAFASDFDNQIKCTRIVNDNDGIPLAPLFGGYHHVGDVIHMRNVDEDVDGVAGKVKRMFSRLVNCFKLDSVADHDMDSYVNTIEKCLKKES